MDKLLAEHRRRFRDFEVVDIIDEASIRALRERLSISTPMSVQWTWTYGEEVETLRRLYEKGKVHQWNAESDLDWAQPSGTGWPLDRQGSILAQMCLLSGRDEATQQAAMQDELAFTLSQLLHGEQAALQICAQLTNLCEHMDEKWYCATQVMDEARHVEALSKFLQRRLGTVHPISPVTKFVLDMLLEAPTPTAKTLGMQVLFEGVALGIMTAVRRNARDPLLADLLRRMGQDEARHAAFGVWMARRSVERASEEEKHTLEDWALSILEVLNANQQLHMLRTLGPRYGVDPELVLSMSLSRRDFAAFNSFVYMHTVVPNLRHLGLLTARTEPRWIALGIALPAGSRSALQS